MSGKSRLFESINKNQIRLRPANDRDLDFLLELRIATMSDHLERGGVPLSNQDHLDRINYHFHAAQIVLYDEEAIGLLKSYCDHTKWNIIQIQIIDSFQGKGIGSFLVKEIIARASKEGLPVSLSVLKNNPAIGLYQSLGFMIKGETELDYLMTFKN